MDRTTKALVVILLLTGTGCGSYETRMYEGKVVDEEGLPINGVSITLCYVGWHWDWTMPGGFPLTWDHLYCSDTETTDQLGNYRISFAGPPSTMIYARHEDWVQVKNFLTKNSRVVLVRREIYQQRRASQEEEKEKAFRQRKPGESGIEYYCRVVRPRANTIELRYHGQRVKVIQALLVESDKTIFAASAPYNTAQTMANEIIIGDIGLNGVRPVLDNFTVLSDRSNCGNNMRLIRSVHHDDRDLSALHKTEKTNIEIPSLRAIFEMNVWRLE